MASAAMRRLILHPDRDATPSVTSDERLLREFLGADPSASEAAFRGLVDRHGPMVMGVCRQILNQDQDAEDAFQATFLALARRAETIRDRRLLSAWLYEVAYRIAIRARSTAARRRKQEGLGVALAAATEPPRQESQAAWAELRPVLHDELNRLPEKYRLPIVLSYLEGHTNEEVAGLLSWPVGTVKGRLSRARDLLRSRLLRRGLALSASFLCSALSQGVTFAEPVPGPLVHRTTRRGLARRQAPAAHPQDDAGEDDGLPLADSAHIEELACSTPTGRRLRDRLLSGLAHGAAALVIVGLVASLIIFSDPVATLEFKRSVASWLGMSSFGHCHAASAVAPDQESSPTEGR